MAKKTTVIALLIAFGSFALRLARLDYVSLRGDESFSVSVSRWDLGRLFDLLATSEPHPPLYYTTLHFWIRIAGESEFAVRFVSLAFGVLTVPAAFALVTVLTNKFDGESVAARGRSAALLASFVIAVNPFLVWHSQDARSYTVLAFFTTASIVLSLSDLSKRGRCLGYVVVTYAAMLTHYSALYVVLAENVAALALLPFWRQNRLAALKPWLTAQVLLAVAYLPWVWWARVPFTSHAANWIQPVDAWESLERTLVALGAGTTVGVEQRSMVLAVVGLALLLSVVGLARTRKASVAWPVAIGAFYFVVPALLLYTLSLWRPMFDERHLVTIVSAFALVVSLGAVTLTPWRWPGMVLATALVGAIAVQSLGNYFFEPQYAKSPGWRALAAEIRAEERDGDYILLNYPDPTAWYYYRGDTPRGILPSRMPLDRAETERSLADLASSYKRIWAVPVANAAWDADGLVEKWLASHLRKVKEDSFGGVRLALFSTE